MAVRDYDPEKLARAFQFLDMADRLLEDRVEDLHEVERASYLINEAVEKLQQSLGISDGEYVSMLRRG